MTATDEPAAGLVEPRLSISGTLRLARRAAAMAVLLATCVGGYYLAHWRGGTNPWPRRFLGTLARIAGVRVRVLGKLPERGAVLLSNHVSWIDICALAGATGSAFVAHDGLAGVRPLRWLCDMNGTVFIARHRRASVAEQVAQIRAAIEQSVALTIFPEGTTDDGKALLPFKSSLLSALESLPPAISVHPVLLDYGPEAPCIAWIGTEAGVANFKRIVARRDPVELTIHVLPALSQEELADRKRAAAAARSALVRTLERVRHPGLNQPS